MAPEPHSNIRVFVRWHEPTVFAGEELKCTITFKNVAQTPSSREAAAAAAAATHPTRGPVHLARPGAHASSSLSAAAVLAHHRKGGPSGPSGLTPPPPPSAARGHRSAQSLSVPSATTRSKRRSGSPTTAWAHHPPHSGGAGGVVSVPLEGGGPSPGRRPGHSHTRSISVLSIGSVGTAATHDDELASVASSRSPRRSHGGHGRHSSLQLTSKGPVAMYAGPASGPLSPRRSSAPFSPTFPDRTRFTTTGPSTPTISEPHDAVSAFHFPPPKTPTIEEGFDDDYHPDMINHDDPTHFADPTLTIRSKGSGTPVRNEYAAPPARIVAASTFAGTPRSSAEFYSMSNHSSETLVSEYVTAQPQHRGQGQARPLHLRRSSTYSSSSQSGRLPEHLMMGYAQVQGSFILDGSLVSLGPFEDVKKKAVVGGQQGGGVVGIEASRREGGLLRGFGWSSIGNSLGELLGGGELSTIKEMRGLASSKSVPLLSTPQSILFVDLHLAPGETRAFEYSFSLPRGLPPTHKGRAIKISYGLVIGTQRQGGPREQHVRSVEVPFRVLSSVNSHGELLGHELMSPYVLLRDQARVFTVAPSSKASAPRNKKDGDNNKKKPAETLDDFAAYVDRLLDRRRQDPANALPSPTDTRSRRTSLAATEEPTTASEAIHLAILRSNVAPEGRPSPNRFEIARGGRRVAVVMLARPAYRLGETVTLAVDLAGADVLVYAVHFALESSERVEPALALRSEASVHRVTRRIHAFSSEATLYSRRAVFTPTIPISASPDFVTSGVSLEWKIRVEFVVPAAHGDPSPPPPPHQSNHHHHNGDNDDDGVGADTDPQQRQQQQQRSLLSPSDHTPPTPTTATAAATRRAPALLEQVSRDEKGGTVMVAAENVMCESFEVPVPLRVYGAVGTGLERLDRDEALEEGLPI